MRVVFKPVRLRAQVSYKCVSCGKSRQKSVKVEHTVNPFNRNQDGVPKIRQEVIEDVKREFEKRRLAVQAGIRCSKCEVA